MLTKRVFLGLLVLVLLLNACKSQSVVPTPDIFSGENQPGTSVDWVDDFEADIEWVTCPFEGDPTAAKCGFLTVPADYSQPKNGETVRLAFAQFKATGEEPRADALLLVTGLPMVAGAGFIPYVFDEVIQNQDIVLFDTRGTGLTEPLLNCPKIDAAVFDALSTGGLSPEDWGNVYEECRQDLENQSINLDQYDFSNSANDLKALRIALEYPAWDLIAIEPVGATLAYEQLRSDTQAVRSLILDSAIPDYNSEPMDYTTAQRVLSDVFALCGQDEKCNAMFPDLETVFYDVVTQLNKEPVEINIYDIANGGRRTTALIDGNYLVGMVLGIIMNGDLNGIGTLPRMIYQVSNGKLDDVLTSMVVDHLHGTDYDFEMLTTLTLCRHLPLADQNDVNTALSNLTPELSAFFQEADQANRAICNAWAPLPVDGLPSPSANLVPVLLVNGGWNWQWGTDGAVEAFTKEAPDLQLVSVPQSGVTTLFGANTRICGQSILNEFVTNPEQPVDASCMPTEVEITWITLR